MAERWVKGDLEALCVGKPTHRPGGSGLARWYQLTLTEAVISHAVPTAGPPPVTARGPNPFAQSQISECIIKAPSPEAADEAVSLSDVVVVNWAMHPMPEAAGESRSTLRGVAYARVGPPGKIRRAAATEPLINRGGCLAVVAGALVASWLWWSCGPFTAGLWATGVLASAYVNRSRRLEQAPMKWPMLAAQHLLGLLLVVGAFGAALDLANPSALASCDTQDGTRVLVALGALVGASLLVVTWPLRWLWVAWSAVMLLWCGRTGSDCAGSWAARAYQSVRGLAPKQMSALEQELQDLQHRVRSGVLGSEGAGSGTSGAPGSGSSGSGSSGSGSSGNSGSGNSGSGNSGSGNSGSGNSGSGNSGSGNSGSGNSGSGNSGSGNSGSGNSGSGNSGAGGTEASPVGDRDSNDPPLIGWGKGTGTPPGRTPTAGTSAEPRISVEEALRDPDAFFQGGSRVMLSGDLLFEFDEDVLRSAANPKLNQVAKLLRLDPQKRVLLEGHADTIGGDAYNQTLSERRAAAVRTWLIDEAHINPSQIDTVGFGSSRPIVPASKGPAAQQPNRRVEVRVLAP